MSQQAKISFNAEATVTQVVKILDEDLTPEQLVEGLNNGELMTTLEHDTEQGEVPTIVRFDEQGNDVPVGQIIRQKVSDDMGTYKDFELSERA